MPMGTYILQEDCCFLLFTLVVAGMDVESRDVCG
jgi:hypothetical protein